MNKKELAKAIAAGVVIAELAVLDYAAVELLRNGVTIEVEQSEVERAGELVESELEAEGETMLEEINSNN